MLRNSEVRIYVASQVDPRRRRSPRRIFKSRSTPFVAIFVIVCSTGLSLASEASLTAEENAYLDAQIGLNYAQKAEVAWLDERGYDYTELDVTVWAREQRARFSFLQDPSLLSTQRSRLASRKFALHRTKANGGYVDTTLPEWQAYALIDGKPGSSHNGACGPSLG